jgi:hypothetical protein
MPEADSYLDFHGVSFFVIDLYGLNSFSWRMNRIISIADPFVWIFPTMEMRMLLLIASSAMNFLHRTGRNSLQVFKMSDSCFGYLMNSW